MATKHPRQRCQRAIGIRVLVRLVALALPIALMPAPALAAKTDVIVLFNGDRLTGEVRALSYGQLDLKTDDAGTISIKWDKIAALKTTQLLQIELADGRRFFGRVPEFSATPGSLRIMADEAVGAQAVDEVSMADIVRIARLEGSAVWYRRLEGSVSLGYSYTPSSSVQTGNVSADAAMRTTAWRWSVALDAQYTSQQNGPPSQRASLAMGFETFLKDRYYHEESLGFSRNQELGLDLRSLLSATFGRYLVQGHGREWSVGAGLAASRETGSDGSQRQSVEGVLTTSARVFRLDTPKTNVTANLTAYPSLSESGRLRGEASVKVRHELIRDLFFEISFADSYDNKPAESFRTNDWNVVTSLGYTY